MRVRLNRLVPPGTDVKKELLIYGISALLFLVFFSFSFLAVYLEELGKVTVWESDGTFRYLDGVTIRSLNELLRLKFFGVWGYLGVCLFLLVWHYTSFTRDSMSIYVMRRLPDAKELHVRCLALPIAALLLGALLTALLLFAYTQLYWHRTPAQCLPAYTTLDIWGAFL